MRCPPAPFAIQAPAPVAAGALLAFGRWPSVRGLLSAWRRPTWSCRPLATALLLLGLGPWPATIRAAIAEIDVASTHQVIRGFGGAVGWRPPLTDDDVTALYGNDRPDRLGLSIYRVRIAPDGDWAAETANARKAAAAGATIMATPWTPPAAMKTGNNPVGGSLKPESYPAYRDYLNSFVAHFAANGIPLHAISLQNEPDWDPDYEGCVWTASQFLAFCRDYAGGITGTRVMMPESLNFNHTLSDPVLNDPVAVANVDIVVGHLYGGGLAGYPLAAAKGKELWMTEHLELTTDWAGALQTAREIHDCLATADFSAYLWWYLKRYYGPLGEDGIPTKRGYVMAQYAKFVRPGYVRIEATENPATGIHVSAYRGPKLVIVALNTGSTDVHQTFTVRGGAVASVTPWTTSGSQSMSEQPAIAATEGSFTAVLSAGSVTTFVQNLTDAGPTFSAQPRPQSVAAGATADFSVAAVAPPGGETLVFAWERNGVPLAGAGPTLAVTEVQPAATGLYAAVAASGARRSTSAPAILGLTSDRKAAGDGEEIDADITHPNGNVFDQVLLRGVAETIRADSERNQITRTSFIDVDDDIVQVELSGPGNLSLVLDAASGPALPVKYNQDIRYMKGHAGIVITGATERTNVSVFSVGRLTAVNPALFQPGMDYDGIAGIAFIAIASVDGRFGGVRTANAHYFADRGWTGLYAPGVTFVGPIYLGDVTAFAEATPVILIGSASDVRITGGELAQRNGRPVQLGGVRRLRMTEGSDSHGGHLPARANQAVLQREGVDVTAETLGAP